MEPRRVLGVYGGPEFQITDLSGDPVTYLMTVFECGILGGICSRMALKRSKSLTSLSLHSRT